MNIPPPETQKANPEFAKEPLKRIGLFGGTFDPVHLGHLLVGQAAYEELQLQRLFFIPASQSPFKPEARPLPPEDRIRLLRLALAGKSNFEIDLQEVERGGISYSIDTVQTYHHRWPGAQIFYLIGADHVPHLPKWRQASELARLCDFVAISRPGEKPAPFPAPFRGTVLKGFPLGLSSSQIRDRLRAGLSVDTLLPSAVAEAIKNKQLYL